MSWFKNPWLADKGSNPWAESNPWAQGKPEFQKAIGQSSKTEDTPIKADNTPDDFQTGYYLEGNIVVFATLVYNTTKYTDEVIENYLKRAANIQKTFGDYDFRFKFVDKPRYDFSGTYAQYKGVNPKIKKYAGDKSPTNNFLIRYDNVSELPREYYMEIFDSNPTAGADGGTHVNTNNIISSCHFAVYLSNNLSRTIVHESLHPLINHTYVKSAENPIYEIYLSFFQTMRALIKQKQDENKDVRTYLQEINVYIRENAELAEKATIIRENIMTTDAMQILGKHDYVDIAFCLVDYLIPAGRFDGFNSGVQLDTSQDSYIRTVVK